LQSFILSIIDYEVSTLLCNCKELLYNYLKKQQSNISRVCLPPRFHVANYHVTNVVSREDIKIAVCMYLHL